ncbi:MAG: hypothetical protein C4524_13075 [Candidatus Zixiibacteriota bacterium]|nr:MAG: hypothetical protein C4524_13075 [candidate division Zixibacteria bacterium]
MKGDRLFKRIIGDLLAIKDCNLRGAVKGLNTAENVRYFEKRGVDMKKVLRFCMIIMVGRGMLLPPGGYYDWGELLDEYKREHSLMDDEAVDDLE